jgi:uncharacterized integral membrane protein
MRRRLRGLNLGCGEVRDLRAGCAVRRGVMAQQGGPDQARQARRQLSGGMITLIVGLAVLLVFIIENRMRITVRFLFWHFIWPLWVYTIVIALLGALAWFGLGVVRRHRRRKERRENRRD